MKILMVNNFFAPMGGVETCMLALAKLLEGHGHQVDFFAAATGDYMISDYPYLSDFARYTPFSKMSKLQQLSEVASLSPIYNFDAQRKLDRFIQKIKPDIVHYHSFNSHLTSSVIAPSIKHKIPFVKTFHSAEWICPSGNLFFKNSVGYCEKELCVHPRRALPCLINKCADRSYFRSLIKVLQRYGENVHHLYDKIPLFICPSQATYDLARRFGISAEKLIILNNVLDEKYMKIQPAYSHQGYFLYVGRLSPEKGLMYLLEAARLCPEISVRIVGTGPLEEEMRAYVDQHQLKNVTLLGFRSGQALEDEYKGCIATVLPCNWFEAFGMTILESFAYGKPVIGSHIGAIPELIENNVTGYTFPTGDTARLAALMQHLHTNPAVVATLGPQCRTRFEQRANPQHHYDQLLSIYQSLKPVCA